MKMHDFAGGKGMRENAGKEKENERNQQEVSNRHKRK